MNITIIGASGILSNSLQKILSETKIEFNVLSIRECISYNDADFKNFDLKNNLYFMKLIKYSNRVILLGRISHFDSMNINIEFARQLFEICKLFNVPYYFISSYSAFDSCPSSYGDEKRKIEANADLHLGSIIRVALIFDYESKPIVALARFKFFRWIIFPSSDTGVQYIMCAEHAAISILDIVLNEKKRIVYLTSQYRIRLSELFKFISLSLNVIPIFLSNQIIEKVLQFTTLLIPKSGQILSGFQGLIYQPLYESIDKKNLILTDCTISCMLGSNNFNIQVEKINAKSI